MSDLALVVDSVVAGYVAEVDILRGVELEVQPGEIVTVLGPNGAGKSTLIKLIAGLLRVRSGSVRLFGKDISNLPAHRMVAEGVGYVPQTNNVFAKLTVEENLEMGAYVRPQDLRAGLEQAYETFPDLKRFRHQPAGRLSGGQRQMVAIARALMHRPRLMLLDEPSAGLSPLLVGHVFDKIREVRDIGVTMLIVEQNAKAALAISDRGYVLAEGRDRVNGPAQELLENPEVGELYLGARKGLA
jgi:ABC-type branched-subunit amino acid transport system ATPase component